MNIKTLITLVIVLRIDISSSVLAQSNVFNGYDFGQHYSRIRIFQYEGYSDVKFLKFDIHGPTSFANWALTIVSEGKCLASNYDIHFYLQYKAYPLVSPYNESFPDAYIKTRHDLIALKLNITTTNPVVQLKNPSIGTWFAMAFVNRPVSLLKSKILNSGCNHYLTTWLDYQINKINLTLTLNEPLRIVLNNNQSSIYLSYYTSTGSVSLILDSKWSKNCQSRFLARINGLPNNYVHDYQTVCTNETCSMKMGQLSGLIWIYFEIQINDSSCLNENSSTTLVLRSTECQKSNETFCLRPYPTRRIMFNYYYDFLYVPIYNNQATGGSTSSIMLNNYDSSIYSYEFVVDDRNIGGTLHFDFESRLTPRVPMNVNISILACLSKFQPKFYHQCEPDFRMIIEKNSMTVRSLPYPQMALWYLTLQYSCDGTFNECSNGSLSLMFQISSSQCTKQQCGTYGVCRIMTSQQNVFSTCSCLIGYRGYGCTDSTYAEVSKSLSHVLFLTLSNLMFLPAIILAVSRRLYIEALIYFFNMFFSTFYHACDQDIHKFCIFKYDGLQLSDFIGSYASFVVTIITMAIIPRSIKAFLFVLGLLTCIVINSRDRFDHIQFIILISTSFIFTVFTWIFVSIKHHRLEPSYKRLAVVTPGFLLALAGLTLFAFCETEDNYWYIHSCWHILIASSILFFLPHKKLLKKMIRGRKSNSNDSITSPTTASAKTPPITTPVDNESMSSSNTDESKKSTDYLINES